MSDDSILFYNWNLLKGELKSQSKILDLLRMTTFTGFPARKWIGHSFILKPKILFSLKYITDDETMQILQIASTRNHFDYWFNGYKGIYLDFCGVSETILKLNRFITIDRQNRLIHLLHEG